MYLSLRTLAEAGPALEALLAALRRQDAELAVATEHAISTGVDLAQYAVTHGLAPLLYSRLTEADLLRALPSDQLQRLVMAARRHLVGQTAAGATLLHVLDVLAAVGITHLIPIKGLALAAILCPAPLLRSIADVDVLLCPTDLQRAYLALQAAGFAREQVRWSPTPWEYHLPHLEYQSISIEPHWRLWPSSPLQPFVLPEPLELWDRAIPGTLLDRQVTIPSAADQLLILVAGLAHDGLTTRLRHWADLYWIAASLTPQDWQQVRTLARKMRMTGFLAVILDCLQELTGVAVPIELSEMSVAEAGEQLKPIVWSRLLRQEQVRPSLWLRLFLSGYRPDPEWQAGLPEYLRNEIPENRHGVAVTRAGGVLMASGKLVKRLGTLVTSTAARQALREELRISRVLRELAVHDQLSLLTDPPVHTTLPQRDASSA